MPIRAASLTVPAMDKFDELIKRLGDTPNRVIAAHAKAAGFDVTPRTVANQRKRKYPPAWTTVLALEAAAKALEAEKAA